MAFYPNFPAIYAYPMPFANQEFYAMYPPGSTVDGPIYFDHPHHAGSPHGRNSMTGNHPPSVKHGYNNRKDSTDSGISDYSSISSRKTSSTSTISNASIMEDQSHLDDIKEELPFEEPDEDLCEQIARQVEFYFSDANITKDKFLLKHVKRNKEGFVSLKLISSFKRVKHLTKDWRQVAFAIEKKSDILEVNDLKTKVRRLDALPEYDETTPSRTVVALDLPLERPTIEGVAEIFSVCGDIVLIRILRPGNPVPADIKPFVNKHPEMTAKVCALVEFERTEFALKAVRELNNEEEEKMKVMELTAPPPKTTKKDDKKKNSKAMLQQQPSGPSRRFSHAGFNVPPQHANPDQMVLGPRRRISLYHNMKFSALSEEQHQKEQQLGGLNPNAPSFNMQQRRISRPPFVHPHLELAAMNQAMQSGTPMYPHGPWMTRRISGLGPEMAASGLAIPPNVVRLPRGPDKGKGFNKWCRNRMDVNPNPNPSPKKPSYAVPIVAPTPEEENQKPAEGASGESVAIETKAKEVTGPSPAPHSPEEAVASVAVVPADAVAAAAPAVEEIVEGAAALAVNVNGSPDLCDSGNEDDVSFSDDQDVEALENERSR